MTGDGREIGMRDMMSLIDCAVVAKAIEIWEIKHAGGIEKCKSNNPSDQI